MITGCPFVDTQQDETGYIEAMSAAIAEALSIDDSSVKNLAIFTGPERRRRSRQLGMWRALGRRNLQEEEVANMGTDSITITYTIDTNIGSATVVGLEATLTEAVTNGDLDALFADHGAENVNVTSLADVMCGLPVFSNEYQVQPKVLPMGLPAYAIALIAIACMLVFCGGSYYAYYRYHEYGKAKEEVEHLHTGHKSDDSMPGDRAEGNAQRLNVPSSTMVSGGHEYDSFEANPYAGQKIGARRASTIPVKAGHDDM